jgi:hypothetical protein
VPGDVVDLLVETDLTTAERRLCQAATQGRLLDLRVRQAAEDHPAQGPGWGPERQIRSQVLFQLLSGRGELDKTFGTPMAVRVRGAQVVGRLNLGGLTLRCPMELYECYLGGRLDLAKSKAADISLRGSRLACRLSARRLRLDHNLNLERLACRGGVRLLGAHIGGQLNCEGATLTNEAGRALTADGLAIDSGLFLSAATVTGEVRLLGAHIGGVLTCEGATLTNQAGPALTADGLTVDRSLVLSAATVTGEVRLLGAHIGGQLACAGATLTNEAGRALSADGLTVDSGLFLSAATVTGEVRLLGAHIGGQLNCTEATLTNEAGRALYADRLTVDRGLFLSMAIVTGEVRLTGAHIGGQLNCTEATLANPSGLAVDLERAAVDVVDMTPTILRGGIDLTHARVGGWYDAKDAWPAWLRLEGFAYDAIDAPGVSARSRLRWVERHQGGYAPQPYEQLAGVYRRAGEDTSARTVAIAKQQARRASPKRWWARWPSRAWSFFLRWTIGYGYRPTLVLPYLVGLFAVGSLVLNHADHAHPSMFAPTKTGPAQPGFNAARYTLDLLLPVANLKQRDTFIPLGYATWWVFGLTLGGWLLALVLVAGLTGVFKRD